jgi:cardiolipin synthase A/B
MPKRIPADFTYHNQVRLIRGGKEYFDLLEKLIDQAEKSIYFQIYIFDEDDTGRRIAKSLMAAANRKVTVHLLLDGYASKSLSTEFVQEMKDAGIHFRWFTSYIKNKKVYIGRRLHHKVIVIDSKKSLVCGLNISDRYNDMPESIAWLDWAAYAEGEVSVDLEQVCKRRIRDYSPQLLHEHVQASEKDLPNSQAGKNNCAIKVNINDWGGRKAEITKSYLQMLKVASSHIIIMSPYFLPGRAFRKRLRQATQRGVTVQVILTGVSDVSLAKYGERYLYDWLMRYNIQIYEYQKNVLHGKMATCDGNWATVGSYNVNNLSAYASIELNLEIKNEAFTKQAEDTLIGIIEKECDQITKESYKQEINVLKRILQGVAYNLLRFMLVLFTFRKRQQD